MAGVNISQLPSSTDLDSTFYVPVESQTKGTKRYPLGSAVQELNDLSDRMETALDTVGDISEQATPLMTPDARGGAKLGDGLQIVDGALTTDLGNMSTGPLASMTGEGHAEQRVTVGKNLLGPFYSGWTSKTTLGVTITVHEDGSFTCDGTATESIYLTIAMLTLPDGTYTLSGCPAGGGSSTYRLYYNKAGVNKFDTGSGVTFTASNDGEVALRIAIYANTTVHNLRFYPQLELGSIATEYEPYTGGAPSPSPDYPQEIRVTRGRNLCTVDSLTAESGGGITASTAIRLGEVVAGETYTVSLDVLAVSGASSKVMGLYVGTGTVLQGENISLSATGHKTMTFTATASGEIRPYVVGSSYEAGKKFVENIQLEAGSTAHPYVPYGCVGLDVVGRNLLKPAETLTKEGVSFTLNEKGQTVVNGTATTNAPSLIFMQNTVMPAGTYTITTPSKPGGVVVVQNTTTGTVIASADGREKSRNTLTFTLNNDTTIYCRYYVYKSHGEYVNFVFDAQLEKGSTAHPYLPYFAPRAIPIPLPQRGWVASLPDGTADVLTLDAAGGYEWDVGTAETVLDGSETWGVGNNDVFYVNSLPDGRTGFPQAGGSLCDRYPCLNHMGANDLPDKSSRYGSSNGRAFYVKDSQFADTAALKSWLASNPVTVLYPLATHTQESGYVDDWPLVPEGTEWDSAELSNVQVRCTDAGVGEVVHAWGKRLAKLEQQLSALIASA